MKAESGNGQRDPVGAIWRRMPAMRKDEFNRLATMLDNERAMNDNLCRFRDEGIELRRELKEFEASRWLAVAEIDNLKSRLSESGSVLQKRERVWKRRVKDARRKALQDVCDVLNYRSK